MFRKTTAELEKELQSTRPIPRTKIKSIEIEYYMGSKRKEIFTDKETLLWALSYQNPLCMKKIKAKYPFLEINGLGKSVSVEVKDI